MKTSSQHTGVYRIRNSRNGRTYIGATKAIKNRWELHKRELSQGAHDNKELQADWNKYGRGAFSFEVVAYCQPERLAREEYAEIWREWLRAFFGRSGKPYNRRLDYVRCNYTFKRRAVVCTTTGAKYKSIKDAATATGVHRSDIGKCVNGRIEHAGHNADGVPLKWEAI